MSLNNTSSSNASNPIGLPKANPSRGLSNNAKVGIGVGVSAGALAIAGFALIIYLRGVRRGRLVTPVQENGRGVESTVDPNAVYEKEETRPVPEFGHDDIFEPGGGVIYEAGSGEPSHELQANGRL